MSKLFMDQCSFTVDMNDTCGRSFYNGFMNSDGAKGLTGKLMHITEEDITKTGLKTVYFRSMKYVRTILKGKLEIAREMDFIKDYQVV